MMMALFHLWFLSLAAFTCGLDIHTQDSPGEKAFYAFKLESALEQFHKDVESCPSDERALGLRAVTRFDLEKFKEAIPDFSELLARNGFINPRLYAFLSLVRAKKIKLEEARKVLESGTADMPKKEWPYPIVEAYLGKAATSWPISAAKNPTQNCDAGYFIGELRLVLGQKREAAEAFALAKRSCAQNLVEYVGAVEELKRLEN